MNIARRLLRGLAALSLAGAAGLAGAQSTPDGRPEAPEPPPLPPKKRPPDDPAAATVNIRTDDRGQLVEEYMQNGRIYMVRVTPENAPPYYLYDLDGDGLFENTDPNSPIKTVRWRVAEWR